jgi:adenosylhomocysteinase
MFTRDVSGIEWVIERCRLLQAIGAEYDGAKPFAGLTIGTGIHLEPKTVALLLTLQRGGAELVSTGNLNTTQQEACDYLAARGVRIVGGPTSDPAEHDAHLWEVVRSHPDLLLDNGGDLFARFVDEPYENLRGGTEETTSGRMRLEPLRDRIGLPLLVINDSPIKQFAENEHAVGQSVLESFLRLTNLSTNGSASPSSATARAAGASPRTSGTRTRSCRSSSAIPSSGCRRCSTAFSFPSATTRCAPPTSSSR